VESNGSVEKTIVPSAGWFPLVLVSAGLIVTPLLFVMGVSGAESQVGVISVGLIVTACVIGLASIFGFFGFIAVQPNDSRVLLLFGDYVGTVKQSGFFWVNPFYSKKHISLRVRNFETGSSTVGEKKDQQGVIVQHKTRTHGRPSKVNDKDGNPIEISAVVVWKVVNTAEALFEVDDYEDYVGVQSEAALRNLATRHPYDSHDHEPSLRSNTQEISDQLRTDIQDRLNKAGVEVIEARISHLAYAPEIAAAMLQRQQASAVVAARTKIVEGAVGMVQLALEHLSRDKIVELDDERKAAMVSNLLVVLCSDRHAQPVVNTGTLHN
jgi:regulator of protease activity HflC (stomatin/prohibitin superfamily)